MRALLVTISFAAVLSAAPVPKELKQPDDAKLIVGDKVTVRQLLSHTHGLPYADCIGDPTTTTANCTAAIDSGPDPVTKPGKVFSYGGVGFEVAGRIIEVVTRQSFEDAFEARLARPLGMTRTRFDEYEGQRFRHPQPAGSAVSTASRRVGRTRPGAASTRRSARARCQACSWSTHTRHSVASSWNGASCTPSMPAVGQT